MRTFAERHAQRIIERDAPVSWTLRRCMRYVIGRLKAGRATWRAQPRTVRRALISGAAAGRQANIRLYVMVQRGL